MGLSSSRLAPIVVAMNDKKLYAQILGISSPWKVTDVSLSLGDGKVEVFVSGGSRALVCPECNSPCPGYDRRKRRWRHLDTCQYQTILVADVPRIECETHGVKLVDVPWAASGSRFTLLFEALVIDWLKEATFTGVARMLKVTWDQVDGIVDRAVKRGLRRRDLKLPRRIGVDETSFQKRHEYVTVVSALDKREAGVIHVDDGHDKKALIGFYDQFEPHQLDSLEAVAMDMGKAYIAATRDRVPDADDKIAFDRFHVAKLLGDGVDAVRREENTALRERGDNRLVGTRYLWLEHPFAMSDKRWNRFESLRQSALKTARAYAIKDTAESLWRPRKPREIYDDWMKWYGWAIRSRLQPIKKAAKTIKANLRGIINAIRLGATNARAEGLNSVIQKLKGRACGYRNRERFKNAIYFHLGGLDLYPRPGEA